MLDNKKLKNFHILEQYDEFMQTSKDYPVDKLPITYPALGLNGEAGEVAEKVKKCWRDNHGDFTTEIKEAILKELADVLWYIWATADDMGYTLDDVFFTSMKKVKERQETNTVHGNGDDREKIKRINNLPKEYKEHKTIPHETLYLKIINNEHLYEGFKQCAYELESQGADTEICMKIDVPGEQQHVYNGKFVAIGRIDGGIIIKLEDDNLVHEICKFNDEPLHRVDINDQLLGDTRFSIIPVISNI